MTATTNQASAQQPDPEDIDEQLEIAAGRRVPFTQLGDWIALTPGLSPQAKALYWHLSMHVSITRADDWVWPSQQVLAEWLGFTRVQSLNRYVDELVAIDALEVELVRYAGGMRQRCRYTVHGTPPEGFTGLQSLRDFYAERKQQLTADQPKSKRRKKPAGGDGVTPQRKSGVAPEKQSQDAPDPQSRDALDPHTKKQDVVEPDEGKRDEPSAGVAQTAEAGAVDGPENSGTGKPARALTKRQQEAADRRAAKTQQDLELDGVAQEDADTWWKFAESNFGKASNKRVFLALRTKIRQALVAGYSREQVRQALKLANVRAPAQWQWDKALAEASGHKVPGPPAGARPGQPAMYDDSQWERRTEPAAEPTLEELDQMFARTG